MKFNTKNVAFQGSSCMGGIDVSYLSIVACFGEPTGQGDGYKVDAEWRILFEDDTYATIYNYKDGKNYCGAEGKDVTEITDWHIGGTSPRAAELVKAALNEVAA